MPSDATKPTAAPKPGTVLILAALVAGAGAAVAADDSKRALKASRYTVTAERAFADGDLLRAKNFYERALAFYPDHPDARVGMGKIMMMERKYEAALNHYVRARESFAEFARVLADREVRRYAEAQNEILRLKDRKTQLEQRQGRIEAAAGNRRPGAAAAGLQMAIGELENRIRRLESLERPGLIEIPEPPAAIHFSVGNALFHLERYEEAVAAWTEAVEIEPRFAPAYNNLALVYGMFARFDEARAWIDRAGDHDVVLDDELLRDLDRLAAGAAEASGPADPAGGPG